MPEDVEDPAAGDRGFWGGTILKFICSGSKRTACPSSDWLTHTRTKVKTRTRLALLLFGLGENHLCNASSLNLAFALPHLPLHLPQIRGGPLNVDDGEGKGEATALCEETGDRYGKQPLEAGARVVGRMLGEGRGARI